MSQDLLTAPHHPATVAPQAPPTAVKAERVLSVDAYRGFVMLAMVSGGLGMAGLIDDPHWGRVADQLTHRLWEGCTFWDLIQPSFMFIVGVSMPFAFALRESKGEGWPRQFGHALKRALLLIAVGVFLDVYNTSPAEFYLQFIRVLQQIALGYLVAFLVLRFSPWVQAGVVVALLVGHTAAYVAYARSHDLDTWARAPHVAEPSRKQPPDLRQRLTENPPNVGTAIDVKMGTKLSLGGYVTFNFVTSAATILLGVLAGRLLQSRQTPWRKVLWLTAAGLAGLILGAALMPVVPMIKRLWTASFTLWAGGCTALMLAGFYAVIDGVGWRRWTFPFVVVGMNSIAIYVVANTLTPQVRQGLRPFLLWLTPHVAEPWQPVLMSVLTTLVLWLFCYWLYRRGIFFKV